MLKWKEEIPNFRVSGMHIDHLLFSTDIKFLVAMSSNGSQGRAMVWDLTTRALLIEIPCEKSDFLEAGIALSLYGQFLAVPRLKAVVELWDMVSVRLLFSTQDLTQWVEDYRSHQLAYFSP